MLKLVIEKELRDILTSTKFIVSFASCALLILLAFAMGAAGYRSDVARVEAARRENLKKMEGLTDWMMVRNNRIFLTPQPLASLVAGVADDIGRTMEVRGRGEMPQEDTRYGEEPVFAMFRFLDLEFIFQTVLSLFAIVFAFDAVSGEKERGTLRLSFANPLPRATFMAGKLAGAFLALAVPLLVPILIGCAVFTLMGVPLTTDEWMRLALIVGAGLLYFGAFLALGIAVSAMTRRSSTSFLALLVIWIFAVLIIPRSAILIAGRAVDVPSLDDINAKKFRYAEQLFAEDRTAMNAFNPADKSDPRKMIEEFQKFMGNINDARQKKMDEFSSRLNEERANAQGVQSSVALGIARISPATCFTLAASALAGTSLALQDRYAAQARGYQESFAKFMLGKTGVNPGGGMVFRMRIGDGEQEKPIDTHELPAFEYRRPVLADVLPAALPDAGVLAVCVFLFFGAAHVAFRRYDLR
ncbi:MAG TPA: ABC transporter permease subunit [Bacteroidota bacterium]|nr:ABC transporter permease subunit [Bacteroidota bacterium]